MKKLIFVLGLLALASTARADIIDMYPRWSVLAGGYDANTHKYLWYPSVRAMCFQFGRYVHVGGLAVGINVQHHRHFQMTVIPLAIGRRNYVSFEVFPDYHSKPIWIIAFNKQF